MKVVLGQLSPSLGRKEKNIEKVREVLADKRPDIALFGELFLTGYECKDDFFKLAEPADGPSLKELSKLSEEFGSYINIGFPERDDATANLYNSAALLCPSGEVHVYRKIHLANFGPFEENIYFGRGNDLQLFDTKIGRIGCLICFDIFFPELAKIYALKGAQILSTLSASPSTSKAYFEAVEPARAVENTAFLFFTNLVGTQERMTFYGGSSIIGPRGDIKARARYYDEDVVECEIDLREIRTARRHRPALRDTRIDILKALERIEEEE